MMEKLNHQLMTQEDNSYNRPIIDHKREFEPSLFFDRVIN
jgi:hypothetical protein